MEKDLLKDIIEWDIVNWSKALTFWEQNIDLDNKHFKCLELGGRKGGLSLWLALKGNDVLCSDLESPEKSAGEIHRKYKIDLQYQSINATDIPYENHFDIICFKSILGGISRNNNDALKVKTIEEIHKALKPNGALLFAENLNSSIFHKVLRKYFVKWGHEWNYLKFEEAEKLFSSFRNVKYITVGFWAAFGRNEKQRNILGKIDNFFDKFVFKNTRYILIGIARK